MVGHVGDGNFHLSDLLDPAHPAEMATAAHLSEQMLKRAIRLQGTCTRVRGIGLHKIAYLIDEAEVGAVEVMMSIQRALDPLDIMNPGQVTAL